MDAEALAPQRFWSFTPISSTCMCTVWEDMIQINSVLERKFDRAHARWQVTCSNRWMRDQIWKAYLQAILDKAEWGRGPEKEPFEKWSAPNEQPRKRR